MTALVLEFATMVLATAKLGSLVLIALEALVQTTALVMVIVFDPNACVKWVGLDSIVL
jgi:hypothetical protein